MEDRLRLIVRKTLGEPCMLNFLLGLRLDIVHFTVRRGQNVVRAQVKRAEHIKRDLAIESKALEPDGRDFLSVLVKSMNLPIGIVLVSTGAAEELIRVPGRSTYRDSRWGEEERSSTEVYSALFPFIHVTEDAMGGYSYT